MRKNLYFYNFLNIEERRTDVCKHYAKYFCPPFGKFLRRLVLFEIHDFPYYLLLKFIARFTKILAGFKSVKT